jgi:hypothetical protein
VKIQINDKIIVKLSYKECIDKNTLCLVF